MYLQHYIRIIGPSPTANSFFFFLQLLKTSLGIKYLSLFQCPVKTVSETYTLS